jgi:hypothetical protein
MASLTITSAGASGVAIWGYPNASAGGLVSHIQRDEKCIVNFGMKS